MELELPRVGVVYSIGCAPGDGSERVHVPAELREERVSALLRAAEGDHCTVQRGLRQGRRGQRSPRGPRSLLQVLQAAGTSGREAVPGLRRQEGT